MLEWLVVFSYSALWALLRRVYGGGMSETPVIKHRGVQTVLMLLSMYPMFSYFGTLAVHVLSLRASLAPLFTLVLCVYVQLEFWAKGHGVCFDMGRVYPPSPEELRRYKERWFNSLLQKVFKQDDWYHAKYDFAYMLLRYTLPTLLLSLLHWQYLVLGLLVSPIYCICWNSCEKLKERYYKGPTMIAEYLVGALFGFVVAYVAVFKALLLSNY